jgi:ADP-heptose:LPS heptosyltransferase
MRSVDLDGACALISDKQLGDVTLLEPLTRLLAARSGRPCALHVKEAFRPLVGLMEQAVWGPDQRERVALSWTTSWSTRAVRTALRVPSRRRCLLVNQPRHVRWWYRWIFREIRIEPIGREYWAKYFWRALGGEPETFVAPRLRLPPDDWRHPELPEGPFLLANPTAAWPSKFWTPQAWAEVMSAVGGGLPWVMTGGGSPEERLHCAEIAERAPADWINLAGRTSLQQYLHALSRARLVTAVDGSASHLAQAFGVPAVTIFGPVYPPKWHWPTPQHRALSAFDYSQEKLPPASAVPVEAVVREVTTLLQEG